MISLHYAKIRKWVQAAVLLAFGLAAFFGLPISNCSIGIGEFRIIYPTGFLENSLLNRTVNMDLVPGMVLIGFLLVVFGRFYCSWVCPASSLKQLAMCSSQRMASRRKGTGRKDWWMSLRRRICQKLDLGFGDGCAIFLGLIIGVAVFDFPFLTIFNPMGIVSRNIVELAVHGRVRYDLLLLVFPLLTGFCFQHGWKTCCPDGLLQGLVARCNRTFVPVVDTDACNGCTRCVTVCPTGLYAANAITQTGDCLKCLQCVESCPTKAVHLALFDKRLFKGEESKQAGLQKQP